MKYIIFAFLFSASNFLVAGEEVLIEDPALIVSNKRIQSDLAACGQAVDARR